MNLHRVSLTIIACIGVFLLSGCAGGKLTPQGKQAESTAVTTASGILKAVEQQYVKKNPNSAVAQNQDLVSAGLSGLADLAQAYVGQTPSAASLSQGAGNPALGAVVQKAIGNQPITQPLVDNLFQAAAQAQSP